MSTDPQLDKNPGERVTVTLSGYMRPVRGTGMLRMRTDDGLTLLIDRASQHVQIVQDERRTWTDGDLVEDSAGTVWLRRDGRWYPTGRLTLMPLTDQAIDRRVIGNPGGVLRLAAKGVTPSTARQSAASA